MQLLYWHVCSIEGELFCKYLTTDSSDPSAWIGRSIARTHTHRRARTHAHTHLLPLCSHWFFPAQYCTAPACSADCTSRTARGEERKEEEVVVVVVEEAGEGEVADTDAAVALLFNTLIIRRQMMKKTWMRHEEELRDGGAVKFEFGGFVSFDECYSSIIPVNNNSWLRGNNQVHASFLYAEKGDMWAVLWIEAQSCSSFYGASSSSLWQPFCVFPSTA